MGPGPDTAALHGRGLLALELRGGPQPAAREGTLSRAGGHTASPDLPPTFSRFLQGP